MLYGIMIYEDKNNRISPSERENAEAQSIAEAIGISQQEEWPKSLPVYFFRCCGSAISSYMCTFNEDFLSSVANGHRRTTPHVVYKFAPKTKFQEYEGLDLMVPADRKELALFLCAIQNYCIRTLGDWE